MAGEQDVDRFLWELEQALAHLDGPRRRELVGQAEDLLHEVAARIASDEGADELTWYHYVQATAEIGPPERLAAELTGKPLPDTQASHARMWALAASLGLVIVLIVGYALLTHGDLETVGAWSGQETELTERRMLTFNVSQEADSVFLQIFAAPTTATGHARVTVLDGDADLVYEAAATSDEHAEATRYLQGAPGTWRVILDFERFTGAWSIDARQELP